MGKKPVHKIGERRSWPPPRDVKHGPKKVGKKPRVSMGSKQHPRKKD